MLDAIGKVLPAHPYELLFRDVVGGHPLDGGVLTFTSKKMSMGEHMTGRTNMLRYHLSSLGASLLRVTLRPVAGDANRCDMVITTDLRSGISKNAKIGFGIGAGTGGVGATIGVGLALAAGTPLVIIPGVVGVLAVLGYGTMRLVRVGFHYSLNQARAELEHLLDAVQGSARSQNVFGTPWGTLPPSNGG
ncbi:MAG: hypothetical protein ABIP66_02520 [Gemmatimonadaceae bacterium]